MDPAIACDLLISYLKQSNLNFQLVETPFAARIEIRKTFIKDKTGISRTSGLSHSTSSELFEEETKAIVANQEALVKENESLQNQLLCCQNELASLKVDKKQLEISQTILEKNKNNLGQTLEDKKSEFDLLEKSLRNKEDIINATKHELDQSKKTLKAKEKELVKIKSESENLLINCEVLKAEISNKNIELTEKDTELGKAFEEKVQLEEKLNSLLDILYGCHGCGLCQCECSEDEAEPDTNDRSSPQHHTPHSSPPPSPEAQPITPGNDSSSWTPPPTPPCESCGGENYGPSPSSLCFACIPPFQIKDKSFSSSPSRTPPGTPPRMRLEPESSKSRL